MARGNPSTKPGIAVVAALVLAAFLIFVFTYDDLKSVPFVQGLTGLVFTLGAAVILFTAIPSRAEVKGPILLAGGAAFFLLAVPRLEGYVFPTYTLSGTIYYVGTTMPVPGVSVRIPGTNQEVRTDPHGDFHMQSVPKRVTKLIANSGGADYEFEIDKGEKYAVIPPQPPPPPRSSSTNINPSEWSVNDENNCSKGSEGSGRKVSLYMWRKQVVSVGDYNKLYVEVLAQGNSTITQTAKLAPTGEGSGGDVWDAEQQDESKPGQSHRWAVPFNGDKLDVKFAVCLASDKGSSTADALRGTYWFVKQGG